MNKIVKSIASLLLATSMLLAGNGLLGTLTSLRATEEGFNEILTGVIMAAYFFGFIIGIYLCPLLLKRVGHIRTFTAFMAIASVSILLQGHWVSAAGWICLRLLVGICLVGVYVVIESWLNEVSTNENRGKTLSVYQMTTLIALALGQYLLLLGEVGSSSLFVLAAALFMLGIVPVALTKLNEPKIVDTTESLNLFKLYQVSQMAILSSLISGLVNGSFFSLGAVSAMQLGMDKTAIAGFISTMILGGALLQWPIGYYSDRYDRRKIIAFAGLFGSIFSILLLTLFQWHSQAVIIVVFLYGGMSFVLYPMGAALLNDIIPRDKFVLAARGMSMTYGIGAATGPVCVGLLMTLTRPEALYVFSAALHLFIAGFGFVQLRKVKLQVVEHETFVPMVRTSPVVLEMHPQADTAK